MNRSIVWLVNSPRFGLALHAALHNTGNSPATVTKAANCEVESDGGEVVEVGALVVVVVPVDDVDVEGGVVVVLVVEVGATDVVGGEDELVVSSGATDGVVSAGTELLEDADDALAAKDVDELAATEEESASFSLKSRVHPNTATAPAPAPPRRPLRNCRREELISYTADEMSMPRSPSVCRSISGSRTVTVTAACLRLTNGISAGTRS